MSDVAEDSDIVDAEIDATPASPAKMSTPRRLGLALMVVTAFALSLARHIPTMSDRFTAGLAHRIGASYVGEIQKNYERGGFVALRGRPVLGAWPSDPVDGPTYANHPPFHFWMTYGIVHRFGRSEATLRALPVFFCALSAALLTAWLGRRRGMIAAGVATVAFSTWPMTFFYGRMASYESGVLLFALIAAASVTRARESRCRRWTTMVVIFVATLIDWVGALAAPALWVFEAVYRGRRPNFRLGVYLAAAATAGVVTYLTVLSVWEGGIGPALDTLVATSRRVRSLWDRTFVEWLRAVGGHVVQLFGWPATVVTAAILIKSVMRPRGFLAAHVVAWFLLCTFNIAMAPKRAFNHEFWWYYLTPAVTVAVAITADALWRRHRRVLALMFVFVCLIPAAWRTIERYKEATPPAGPAARFLEIVDGFTTEDDLLAISAYPAPWMYYCKPWLYVVRSEETILEHVDRYRSGALGRNRRFFFILANVLLETQPNVRRRLDTESVMKQSVPEYTIYELRRPPKRATSR